MKPNRLSTKKHTLRFAVILSALILAGCASTQSTTSSTSVSSASSTVSTASTSEESGADETDSTGDERYHRLRHRSKSFLQK